MNDSPKTIVVVEDDTGMRESMEFLLKSHGFGVATFATSEDLPEKLSRLRVSCVILDIHLSGPDGLAVYEHLTNNNHKLPAIFITGQVDERIRAESKRLGAIALLEKPFSDASLLDAVDRALQHKPAI